MKLRFKIDVVIMIICSIVIIINSVLTLQVSTAKPMIAVCFQYLFMHVVCANIFGANVLEPRFKIDVVIMII